MYAMLLASATATRVHQELQFISIKITCPEWITIDLSIRASGRQQSPHHFLPYARIALWFAIKFRVDFDCTNSRAQAKVTLAFEPLSPFFSLYHSLSRTWPLRIVGGQWHIRWILLNGRANRHRQRWQLNMGDNYLTQHQIRLSDRVHSGVLPVRSSAQSSWLLRTRAQRTFSTNAYFTVSDATAANGIKMRAALHRQMCHDLHIPTYNETWLIN